MGIDEGQSAGAARGAIHTGMDTIILLVFAALLIAAILRRPPSLPVFGCCLPLGGKPLPPAQDARAGEN